MANKTKKKRNKKYQGADAAAPAKPSVTRISAVNRSKMGQWWFDNKKVAKPVLIAGGVIFIIVWLIIEITRIAGL